MLVAGDLVEAGAHRRGVEVGLLAGEDAGIDLAVPQRITEERVGLRVGDVRDHEGRVRGLQSEVLDPRVPEDRAFCARIVPEAPNPRAMNQEDLCTADQEILKDANCYGPV